MTKQVLKTQSIVPRLDGIQRDVMVLENLGKLSAAEFAEEDNFVKAQFYLRRAREGVFHIASHVLSRIPGARVTEYKAIAVRLGEVGIVPKGFAQTRLKAMAGYRNRLTHFYADVRPDELQMIIQNELGDFMIFSQSIKELLRNPQRFNLGVE